MRSVLIAMVLAVFSIGLAFAQVGVKNKRVKPYEYGMVTIANFSIKAGLAPVVFDHWRHRSKFTCRLCHADIGFAMKAGGTQIKAVNNSNGYYCGTCHNGKFTIDNKAVFASCAVDFTKEERKRCDKCHSTDRSPKKENEFYELARKLPKGRFGNGIDWEKAEERGFIKPIDYIEGVSIKRTALSTVKDFSLSSKVEGMPNTIFSHKKHTVWNGCEVCHPELFVGIKKGSTKYSMIDIFDGKYCGVCHKNVAFPMEDCQRCHTKPVQ